MTPSRERALAAALCVVGAGVALLASSQRWIHAVIEEEGFPRIVVDQTGRSAVPGIAALALVALAGTVALFATRGWGRVVVGAILVVTGGGILAQARNAAVDLSGIAADAVANAIGREGSSYSVDYSWWPPVAAVGGVLVLAGGLVVIVRGRRWPGMSRRYESADAPRVDPTDQPTDESSDAMWKALDRGEDPTDPRP